MYLLGIGFSAVAACWAMGVALRARTIQAAPLMQVVIFLSVFTSVAYAPREVLTGWLHTAANINPVTHILEVGAGRRARAPELADALAGPGGRGRDAAGAGGLGPHGARDPRAPVGSPQWPSTG